MANKMSEKDTKEEILKVLGASEVSANLYCNSRTSVLGRLSDNLRLLMGERYIVRIFFGGECCH